MLTRTESVSITWERTVGSLLTGKGRLTLIVGRRAHLLPRRQSAAEFDADVERSEREPVLFATVNQRQYWHFNDRWYVDNEHLDADTVRAIIVTGDERRQATINRAKTIVAMGQRPERPSRQRIPEDVKQLVWTRDGGACVRCGAQAELQFDHIIPWSAGGASTPENLQVLCGPCNRLKGASVTAP